jgi:hypothetical protein
MTTPAAAPAPDAITQALKGCAVIRLILNGGAERGGA